MLQLHLRQSSSGILLGRPRSHVEELGRDVPDVAAGSDPSMGVSFAALRGMGSLKGFWVVFPWLWETGSRMVPLLLAARCFTPKDWMLAKQHHSSLELSAKMNQINRNN